MFCHKGRRDMRETGRWTIKEVAALDTPPFPLCYMPCRHGGASPLPTTVTGWSAW